MKNLIGRDTKVWCKEGLRTALPTKRGSWCHSAFRGLYRLMGKDQPHSFLCQLLCFARKNVLKCIQLNVKVAT
uniref:Uncharacterized protein n=1 Tax=Xenopus tropicalis TaxID=8364 RepID=A0A1B8XY86_XENTR